jgi:phosphoribosylaminoimidazole-succinocarboxamide synthase
MMTPKRKKIYEGKAKILYEGPEPGTLIQYFKDDATAFNAQKKATLEGKGVLNNKISEFIMMRLNGIGVTNHFIKPTEPARAADPRSRDHPARGGVPQHRRRLARASASASRRARPCPARSSSSTTRTTSSATRWSPRSTSRPSTGPATQEIDDILAMTLRVNDFLSGMFGAVGITLVDFKIEFGRVWENDFARIILADEISPDSCRLWDSSTGEKLDKDRFRRDLGNVIESYAEVARRLGIMKDMPTVIQGGLH